jgi:hypothetical protein
LSAEKCACDLGEQAGNPRIASPKQNHRLAGLQKLLKKARFFERLPYICSR